MNEASSTVATLGNAHVSGASGAAGDCQSVMDLPMRLLPDPKASKGSRLARSGFDDGVSLGSVDFWLKEALRV
jgi:hypothetical protein